jgi:hypothetical protein
MAAKRPFSQIPGMQHSICNIEKMSQICRSPFVPAIARRFCGLLSVAGHRGASAEISINPNLVSFAAHFPSDGKLWRFSRSSMFEVRCSNIAFKSNIVE